MKLPKLSLLFLLIFLTSSAKLSAQAQEANKNTNVTQLKIMVIPFTKDGEDIRTILDADFDKRLAMVKVKNGFDNRGFTTVDFMAALKQAKDDKIFSSNVQSDVKSTLIQFSGADVYVEVDINLTKTVRGGKAMVLVSAYDAATASAYASVNCDSQEHYNTDNATLITASLSNASPGVTKNDEVRFPVASQSQLSCMDDFLNILQGKLTEILEKGRPVKINFQLANDASKTFDSKVRIDGVEKQLKDAIDDWLGDNAYKGNLHLKGQTKTAVFYDDVRLPIFDKNGNNFRISKFAQKISEYLQSKGISADRDVKNGAIYITITN